MHVQQDSTHQHDTHNHQHDDYCTCCRVCNLQDQPKMDKDHQMHHEHEVVYVMSKGGMIVK